MNEKTQKKLLLLQEEIQYALEDVAVGQIRSAHLPGRMKRTIQGILSKHRMRSTSINIVAQGSGYVIDVTLPPQGPIVQAIRLRFS